MAMPIPAMPDPSNPRYHLLAMLRAVGLTERDLRLVLEDAAQEAERTIPKLIEQATTGARVNAAQRAVILREIRAMQAAMWGEITPELRAGIARANEYAAAGDDVLYGYVSGRLGAAAANTLRASFIARAKAGLDAVLAKAKANIPLSTQVYRTQALATGLVHRVVNQGLLLGKSAREIAKSVRNLIDPKVPGGVSYAAFRLARTEINHAYQTSQEARYADEPWSRGMQWHLSGSHPEPDECDVFAKQNISGLGPGVYAFGELPDEHPNGLCYRTPVQVEEDEFVDRFVMGEYDEYLDKELGVDPRTLRPSPTPPPQAPASMYESRIERALKGGEALDAVKVGLPRRGSLDRKQRDALKTYESAWFVVINGFLRRAGIVEDKEDERTQRDIERIDSAMDKSVLPQDVQTWRGLSSAAKLFGDRLEGNLEGFEWQELAYSSTSALEKVADDFMVPRPGQREVKMRVLVRGGTKGVVISLGGLGGQAEILLERGTHWRVVKDRGVHPTKGYRLIDVEVWRG